MPRLHSLTVRTLSSEVKEKRVAAKSGQETSGFLSHLLQVVTLSRALLRNLVRDNPFGIRWAFYTEYGLLQLM